MFSLVPYLNSQPVDSRAEAFVQHFDDSDSMLDLLITSLVLGRNPYGTVATVYLASNVPRQEGASTWTLPVGFSAGIGAGASLDGELGIPFALTAVTM